MYPSAEWDLSELPPPPLSLPEGFLPGAPVVYRIAQPVPYLTGYRLQLALVRRFVKEPHPPVLLLLEHEPVATLGRSVPLKAAPNLPLPVYKTHRGGRITFHGPGQVVGYPIVHLRREKLGVVPFISLLEEVLLKVCQGFSVPAQLSPGQRGVFTPQGKVASLGIAVHRGVTWHGFALYYEDQRSLFALPPCNLPGVSPDHLSRYTTLSRSELEEAIVSQFFAALGYTAESYLTISLHNLENPSCPILSGFE